MEGLFNRIGSLETINFERSEEVVGPVFLLGVRRGEGDLENLSVLLHSPTV